MSKFHSNWRKFLTEGTFKEERLLREVSEDEVEHIRKALDELGPEQLAFQHIFGCLSRSLQKTRSLHLVSLLTSLIVPTMKLTGARALCSGQKNLMIQARKHLLP